jgi:hypothetical protein
VRRRLAWWLLVAVLAAGCTTSNANEGTPSDQTDVWFIQHMAGQLLQTTAILDLAGDRITHPKLARLAETMNQQQQDHLQQPQGWLDSRGLAPYDPSRIPPPQGERPDAAVRGAWGRVRSGLPGGDGGPAPAPGASSRGPSSARAACLRSVSSPPSCWPNRRPRSTRWRPGGGRGPRATPFIGCPGDASVSAERYWSL